MLNTIDNLYKEMDTLINDNVEDREIRTKLSEKFLKKGLNLKTLALLFNNQLDIENLTSDEMIAILTTFKENNYTDIEIKDFFSNEEITNYLSKLIVDDSVDMMSFKYARRVTDDLYEGWITYKQIYDYYRNRLIIYNKETQRASKVRAVGVNRKHIKKISVKASAVKEIKRLMHEKKYSADQITLNVRIINKNYEPNFQFIDKLDGIIGDIIIQPEYDVDSTHYTLVEIIDGYHRFLAAYRTYEEALSKGVELDKTYGLFCKIVIVDEARAKEIVNQTFQRSDTDKDFLESLKQDDYTKFVDLLISKNRYLNGHVADTFDYCKLDKENLTYKTIITAVIKTFNDLNVTSLVKSKYAIEELNEIVVNLVDILKEEYFDNDMDIMKEESYLLDVNMWPCYFAIAQKIRKYEGKYVDKILEVAEKLYEVIDDEDIEKLRLKYKSSFLLSRAVEYFDNLLDL